ncbi:low molecular weight phosphotyrosine protein phosphatase [Metallosphaera cuprina Ar-4]|uniref:Low molecular weight phosphotyrosine protein phosphatase n=1 Tax=Metallosphaera cuprina (strain Ar-4) TaxID=1006006 RepID=F4G224_METCR|nr:low molecular weight phosphotyrosine protein phosphatase [Metallosphaera cuprina Ar-4]
MSCFVKDVCPASILTRTQRKLIKWNINNSNDKLIERERKIRDEMKSRILRSA